MPKLWRETIAAHRDGVGQAIENTTAALVSEQGLRSVTMSQIAEETGIGRATLYNYSPDIESILVAWHDRHVAGHLQDLRALRDGPGTPTERLDTVLSAYALIQNKRHATQLGVLLHREEHVAQAQEHLRELIRELLTEGAAAREVRTDVSADELATYCLFALAAAGSLRSERAVHRLVAVTLAGLRRSP